MLTLAPKCSPWRRPVASRVTVTPTGPGDLWLTGMGETARGGNPHGGRCAGGRARDGERSGERDKRSGDQGKDAAGEHGRVSVLPCGRSIRPADARIHHRKAAEQRPTCLFSGGNMASAGMPTPRRYTYTSTRCLHLDAMPARRGPYAGGCDLTHSPCGERHFACHFPAGFR
jgi:hypothetical protein